MGVGLEKLVRASLRGVVGVPWASIRTWIPGKRPTWWCDVPRLGSCSQRWWQGQQGCHPELCLRVTGSPGWGREALVLIERTRISPRHLTSFHLTF